MPLRKQPRHRTIQDHQHHMCSSHSCTCRALQRMSAASAHTVNGSAARDSCRTYPCQHSAAQLRTAPHKEWPSSACYKLHAMPYTWCLAAHSANAVADPPLHVKSAWQLLLQLASQLVHEGGLGNPPSTHSCCCSSPRLALSPSHTSDFNSLASQSINQSPAGRPSASSTCCTAAQVPTTLLHSSTDKLRKHCSCNSSSQIAKSKLQPSCSKRPRLATATAAANRQAGAAAAKLPLLLQLPPSYRCCCSCRQATATSRSCCRSLRLAAYEDGLVGAAAVDHAVGQALGCCRLLRAALHLLPLLLPLVLFLPLLLLLLLVALPALLVQLLVQLLHTRRGSSSSSSTRMLAM